MAMIALMQNGGEVPWRRVSPPELVGKGLVVGQIDHHPSLGLHPIAEGDGRMVQILGAHAGAADLVGAFGEIVRGNGRRELIELDREVGILHLASKDIVEGAMATLRRIDGNGRAWHENRGKKRKAL